MIESEAAYCMPKATSAMMASETLPHIGDGNIRWTNESRLLGILAHPARLAILEALCDQPRCVKHINALVPLAQSHLSQHLSALRKANLVASLACGSLRCYYLLRPTLVKALIGLLRQDHPVEKTDCVSMVRELKDKQSELAKGA